jgi:hypothetical protein
MIIYIATNVYTDHVMMYLFKDVYYNLKTDMLLCILK